MTRAHYDALPQGLTRWQLTICLTIIATVYLTLAYMDGQDAKRADCLRQGQIYSDSLDQCLKEIHHAAP